ncbi:MAG: GDP-mannose 4,6-dehydratase [bacterium]|nr:MAG: GDP-mannose 4,6-dehydratase [bacterium]
MKKVLVTGAAGFIGSHLSELFVRKGIHVKAFIRYNSKNSWGWLEESSLKDEMEIVAGDIRDYDMVHAAMKGTDAVFHLAALIGIPYSYVSPLAYIRTNIEGSYNVLQAAKDHALDLVIMTSTSETYGTGQYIPIDENHPMVGQSPYSATKIAADQIALSYFRSFDLPVKIVRPFNTYGPRQSARAIIPTVITQILDGQKEIRLGNISPTRDLTYVTDTVEGFLEISKSADLFGEITNIGSGREISVENLVRLISELMQTEIDIQSDQERVRPGKSEVERLLCDNSKIMKFTQWSPRIELRAGLLETIEWLKGHQDLYKSELYNV